MGCVFADAKALSGSGMSALLGVHGIISSSFVPRLFDGISLSKKVEIRSMYHTLLSESPHSDPCNWPRVSLCEVPQRPKPPLHRRLISVHHTGLVRL